jgi:hypothetical protein
MSDPAWLPYLCEVRAKFDPAPAVLLPYLDTFERDSMANREARRREWDALPPDIQRALQTIMMHTDPQLFS